MNNNCQFESSTNTSSATICKHCGKEKWQHQQNRIIAESESIFLGISHLKITHEPNENTYVDQPLKNRIIAESESIILGISHGQSTNEPTENDYVD